MFQFLIGKVKTKGIVEEEIGRFVDQEFASASPCLQAWGKAGIKGLKSLALLSVLYYNYTIISSSVKV